MDPEDLSRKLTNPDGPVTLTDATGKVVGTFTPEGVDSEPDLTLEEVAALLRERTYTTAEVLSHLGRQP